MFTSMKKLAEDNLKIGQICTVRKVEVYSSWCGVWVEEIPGKDDYLNLMFFDHYSSKLFIQNRFGSRQLFVFTFGSQCVLITT
jgi:hypothetical protein